MDQQLINVARNGNLPEVKRLVAAGANPAAQDNDAIIGAAEHGHLNVVQYLVTLPGVDAAAPNNNAIILALGGGYWDIVRFLASLQGFDPQGDNYDLFIWAISKGLINIVNHLGYRLPVYIYNNHALVVAAQNGNLEIVDFLMKQPGVNDKDGTALYVAEEREHEKVAEYLRNYRNNF